MNIYLNGLKINRRQRRHMFIEERMNQKLFDPGRGRTLFLHRPFYKHANPPGWKSIKGRSPMIFVTTRSPQNRRGVALKSFPFYIVNFSDARADAPFLQF